MSKLSAFRALALGLACFAASHGTAQAQAAKSAAPQAELDALTKAAKAESGLTFYSAATENVARRVANAFSAKYGVKASFVRLNSNNLRQRFSAEAQTGTFVADVAFIAGSAVPYALEGIKRGWVESISEANIPVLMSGEYPARFNKGPTAMIQATPWLIVYNNNRVKGADIPKDWTDLLDPKWKGQFLLADPRASDAHLDLWSLLLDKYGESFFTRLRALNPRQHATTNGMIQALAAGEGSFALPTVLATVMASKDKGAPLDVVTPDHTTGVEMQVMLTHRAKAKHPSAARLFANYVMSPDGNKVVNDDPGGITLYDTSRLPKQYEGPNPDAMARRDRLFKLLGF